jgi:autotransporter strand-loop-strand O-heptosyltransferase
MVFGLPPSIKYFIKWRVEIWQGSTKIKEKVFDCKDKLVHIHLDSKSIGDTLAWFPYIEEFRKQHKCKIACSTFHNDWFAPKYPDIIFTPPGIPIAETYANYNIGWYYDENDKIISNQNPFDVKQYPLQKTASDILGLHYKEVKPKLVTKKTELPTNKKYVIIAPHGSKHSSYWQYPGGWQTVIDFLKKRNYKVVMMSSEP